MLHPTRHTQGRSSPTAAATLVRLAAAAALAALLAAAGASAAAARPSDETAPSTAPPAVDDAPPSTGSLAGDRHALMALYRATGGADWTNNANWGSGLPLQRWRGVIVDDGRVTALVLDNNNLSGALPDALGSLDALEMLDLAENSLSGPIPDALGNMASLRQLELSINSLSGPVPAALARLENLIILSLTYNDLTGPIPAEFADMSLRLLELNLNDLSGEIPPGLLNSATLLELQINGNNLSGPIPQVLNPASRLKLLYLNGNELTGHIPPSLGNLSELKLLYINGNELTGHIPPSLAGLADLTHLQMQYNNLTGCVPAALQRVHHIRFDDSLRYCEPRLADLSVDPAELVAPFDADRLDYFAHAAPTATEITVNAQPRHNGQTLTHQTGGTPSTDADPDTDGHQIAFPEHTDELVVAVTASDGPQSQRTYTITVLRRPQLTAAGATVQEGEPATVQLTLPHKVRYPVTIDYSTQDGTATAGQDYTAASGTATIEAGDTETTITIQTTDDDIHEGTTDETLTLTLDPHGAEPPNTTPTITIQDNDPLPSVSIKPDITLHEAPEQPGRAVLISLDRVSSRDVTVGYATSDGTATAGEDYDRASGTITIPAGQLSASLAVTILDDDVHEGDETFTVTLLRPRNATLGDREATVTIIDDDPLPSVSIKPDITLHEAPGRPGRAVLISLDRPSSRDVTVDYATSDGTATAGEDYGHASGTITIPTGHLAVGLGFTTLDDDAFEGDETFTVTIRDPRHAVLNPSASAVVVTIVDDETIDDARLEVSVSDTSVQESDTGQTRAASFAVTLNKASDRPVSVRYSTQDGSALAGEDYRSSTGMITFFPGATVTFVRVEILDDNIDENDETFTLRLTMPVNVHIEDAEALATIIDDD